MGLFILWDLKKPKWKFKHVEGGGEKSSYKDHSGVQKKSILGRNTIEVKDNLGHFVQFC